MCCVLSCSVVSDSLGPHGLYSLPGSSVNGDSPGKNTRVGCHAFLQGMSCLPNPRIEPRSPSLQRFSTIWVNRDTIISNFYRLYFIFNIYCKTLAVFYWLLFIFLILLHWLEILILCWRMVRVESFVLILKGNNSVFQH